MNASNFSLNVLVDMSIVKTIFGSLLIDPDSDEDDLNNADNALHIFQLQDNADEEEDVNSKHNLISVGKFLQFSMIIKYIGAGLSFWQCCNVLFDTKQVTGLAQIGRIAMTKVILYTWYMCTIAFQMMQDILNTLWCFSIAFDVGNKSNTFYLGAQIWFCQGINLHNLHVIALPMQQCHTRENMFLLIVTIFDALLSNWKGKLIGISSDGASNMTGAYSGVVTHLQKLALPGLYCIWCYAHVMDLVVQKAIAFLCNKIFVASITGITGHLHCQVNLISEMQYKCPQFGNTCWLSMEQLLSW